MDLISLDIPAYQGAGWQPRQPDTLENTWADYGVNTEWSRLKAVLLYIPGEEYQAPRDPRSAQHLEPLNVSRLAEEFNALADHLSGLGIQVFKVNPHRWSFAKRPVPPNLLFQRDLFFNTSSGAVIARMASQVRAGEEKYTAAALAEQGIAIRRTISGDGCFEGADALWLHPEHVICGVNQRTNESGLSQLQRTLTEQNVLVTAIPMPRGVQHLLGLVQLVDKDLALIRHHRAPMELKDILRSHGFQLVPVDETEEVVERQALNFVTVARRKVLIASDCPQMKELLQRHEVEVVGEVNINELRKAAGGLACATGIVSREKVL